MHKYQIKYIIVEIRTNNISIAMDEFLNFLILDFFTPILES